MPAKSSRLATMTTEEIAQLLTVVRQSDSIELKLTVGESNQFSTAHALDIDPLTAQIRQVYFFDTPDLELNKLGVVVRARRIQGKASDTVVKLRPVVPAELPAKYRKSPDFKVEVDVTPGGYVCSGSLVSDVGKTDVRNHLAEGRPLRKLFSPEQREFYASHANDIAIDDLSVLGPIFVLKGQVTPKGFSQRITAEVWMYPDNSRAMEISTKCLPGQGLALAEELKTFLDKKGVEMSDSQQTKTSKALQYFSKQLKLANAA